MGWRRDLAEVVVPGVVWGRRLCKGAMEGRRFPYYELMRKVSRTKIEEASCHVTQFCSITKLHSSSFTLCPFWRGLLFLCFVGPHTGVRMPRTAGVGGDRGRLSCSLTWFSSRCLVAPGLSWSGDLGAAGLFLAAAAAMISSRLLWIARVEKLFPLWLFLTRSEHLRCFQVSLAAAASCPVL